MNIEQSKGELNILRGKLKSKYGDLIDDELIQLKGGMDELIGTLQKQLGKSKEEIENEIENIVEEVNA